MASLAKACTAARGDTVVKHQGHRKPHQEARGSICLPYASKGRPIWCHLDAIPLLVGYIKVFLFLVKGRQLAAIHELPRRVVFSETPAQLLPAKGADVQRRLLSGCTNLSCAQTYFY
jgi:hypothetical protein